MEKLCEFFSHFSESVRRLYILYETNPFPDFAINPVCYNVSKTDGMIRFRSSIVIIQQDAICLYNPNLGAIGNLNCPINSRLLKLDADWKNITAFCGKDVSTFVDFYVNYPQTIIPIQNILDYIHRYYPDVKSDGIHIQHIINYAFNSNIFEKNKNTKLYKKN